MPKLEMTKTIEARKLHKRTRLALPEPPVTIPYGAILDDVTDKDDMVQFQYLGELYQCPAETLRTASQPLDAVSATSGGAAPAPAPKPTFVWQKLAAGSVPVLRAKVPGGWLVAVNQGVAFYPDTEHSWDGTTLPL